MGSGAAVWSSYGLDAYHAGEAHVAVIPKGYRYDGTVRGVLFCHSRGGDATQGFLPTASTYAVIQAVARAGFPVLTTDLGGTDTWGNDTAIARLTEAKTYLQGAAWNAKAGTVLLLGQSMGALAMLNWARQNLASVAAAVGLVPVSDLNDVYANNRGGFAAGIDTAYGGSYVDSTQKALHNPAYFATLGDLAGLNYQAHYGSSDTIVIPSTVTGLVSAIGGTASAVNVGAYDHSTTLDHINTATLTAFLAAHA